MSDIKITKKVLLEELRRMGNILELRDYGAGYYKIIDNKGFEYWGTSKEIFCFLKGVQYVKNIEYNNIIDNSEKLKFAVDTNESNVAYVGDSYSCWDREFYKKKIGKNILIDAKRNSIDPYYSQDRNSYRVKILGVGKMHIECSVSMKVINRNGNIKFKREIPPFRVIVGGENKIEQAAEKILKAVDNELLSIAGIESVSIDEFLWVDKYKRIMICGDRISEGIDTKSVDIKVI